MDGGPTELVAEDVRRSVGDHLVPGLRQRPQRDLVRHGRRRDEDGGILAEQRGGSLLERDDGRVLALLLVPHDGLGDRRAHRRGRLREGVRAEVDHALTVPGGTTGRSLPGVRERTRNAPADTSSAAVPLTVNARLVPPNAASHPASRPPAGAAPLKAK